MSLPPWITDRLPDDRRVNTKLTQEHVVETMHRADRPFFSLQQIQDRIKPDVSKVTLRNRLDELADNGIVATETFPDSLTLYYLDHPESEWPLSPAGERALNDDTTEDTSPLREFWQHPRVRSVLREELLRSIGWAALGLFGWPVLVTSSQRLSPSLWTVVVLPVLTWASLTVGMVSYRLLWDSDLRVHSTEGLHVVALGSVLLSGFWAVFLVFVLGWPLLWTGGAYVLATVASLVFYSRVVVPRSERPAES